ncbi:TerD family protein [Streptomyces rubiginosohelvolus]|uniref:TerD family protein n=1 Tax=Streptomyces rubiginosohelvolus TaxID=67362 RepID=UPI0033EB5765
MDDVLGQLTPEHFAGGRIPSRSTVSDRLAGVGLREDFVQAIADLCSHDSAERELLLAQADAVRKSSATDGGGAAVGTAAVAADIVVVQQRSIEVSDKLVRAMERAAVLERERNGANQMVLVLLAMVDKLHRDTDALTRERDRLRAARSMDAVSDEVRERLIRSEQQRVTAEAELERARAEREKADRLAEEAAEQVVQLTKELQRLRGDVPGINAEEFTQLPTSASELQDALSGAADDFDLALVKAGHHLDDRADRLDQLEDELRLDNTLDNSSTRHDASDNFSSAALNNTRADSALTAEEIVVHVRGEMSSGGDPVLAEGLIQLVATGLPIAEVLRTATLLQEENLIAQATQLILETAANIPADDMPALISGLHSLGRDAEIYQVLNNVARSSPAAAIIDTVMCLRGTGHHADGYQVLSAVGRDCPPEEALKVLAGVSETDAQWILDAACRDRPLDELPLLADALRPLRRPDSEIIERAHRRRQQAADRKAALPARARPASGTEGLTSGAGSESFLRPYALAGGDSAPRTGAFPLSALVRTTASASQLVGVLPEHEKICQLCRTSRTIGEVAELLAIPAGVARILVADLAQAGLLTVQADAAVRLDRDNSMGLVTESSQGVLAVSLGWESVVSDSADFELDVSAIGLRDGSVYSDHHFVFFNNPHASDRSLIHNGGAPQPRDGAGYQETILVDLAAVPTDMDKVVFLASIYDADARGQNFSYVHNPYISVSDGEREFVRYHPSPTDSDTAMVFGDIHRYGGQWHFKAVGQGYTSGLRGVAMHFGVNV